jgi:serine-type D-Ala-D-Ala carboxypeptidase/endopeptidase
VLSVAQVEGILESHARKHVGVIAGVRLEEQVLVAARGLAWLDRPEEPGIDTIFEIGSITKVFTAAVLAQMVEEDAVTFDDPVQLYLPPGVTLPCIGRPITLLDLATQASGLPRLPSGFLRRSLANLRNPYGNYTIEDLHAAIAKTRLNEPPGLRVRYSNLGYGLLGHALTYAAGASFEELVRSRICQPLGLRDTVVSICAQAAPRFADGHNRWGTPVPHWDFTALEGAGALRSTVRDLMGFLKAQLEPPPTRLGHALRQTQQARVRNGELGQALGWARLHLKTNDGPGVLLHNGRTGGFGSFVGFVPERQAAVVVLTNCSRAVDALGLSLLRQAIQV